MKEFFRKKIVGLKRNPSIIPMLMLVISFLVFSLNLTLMSDTTAKIMGPGMGLSQFAVTLFSLLSLLCMMNSYPRRKKPNVLMLTCLFAMLAVIVFCDGYYISRIVASINSVDNPIRIDDAPYILKAQSMLYVHIVCICLSALLAATLPLYSKLIRRINTSVAVEENAGMHTIELSE